MSNMLRDKKIDATVYNFAFGDAWGYVTEFKKFKDIKKKQYPVPNVLKVSDDTQMGIYTMSAVKSMLNYKDSLDDYDYGDVFVQNRVRNSFARAYLMFFFDADNNRAPGMTCMSALERYHYSVQVTGLEGSVLNNSLGCGTIMRTPWLGLLPYSQNTLANLAVLQSQVTHGDPVGWIVSAVLTLMINDYIFNSENIHYNNMFEHALHSVSRLDEMNLELLQEHHNAIQVVVNQLSVYNQHWDEIASVLAESHDDFVDLNAIFGEGWIADQTLYNALAAVNLYSDESSENIFKGIKRLVYTEGDSDSIAAVGGALWGAKTGITADEKENIMNNLEPRYKKELEDMVSFIKSF